MNQDNSNNTIFLSSFKNHLKDSLENKSKHQKKNITFYISIENVDKIEILSKKYNVSKSALIETLIETINLD